MARLQRSRQIAKLADSFVNDALHLIEAGVGIAGLDILNDSMALTHRHRNTYASIVAKSRFRTIIPVAAKSASGEGDKTTYPARRGPIS